MKKCALKVYVILTLSELQDDCGTQVQRQKGENERTTLIRVHLIAV